MKSVFYFIFFRIRKDSYEETNYNKKCIDGGDFKMKSDFESKFESYIENKVKEIMDNPNKHPNIKIIYGEDYDPEEL